MSTLVNSILEKIDNIRVSRDNLNKAITDKLNVDASAFKVIESMNYAGENLGQGSGTPGTPTEAYAIRQDFQGGNLAYPINVRLTTDSWVSFDFALSEKVLTQSGTSLLGVSQNSLNLLIDAQGFMLNIGSSQIAIACTLDTAIHNISFGFVNDVNPSNGYVRFKVELDNVEMYNDYIAAPNFNLPLFLFGCPCDYYGTYEDYELLGGASFLLNEYCMNVASEYFYIFGLKVYHVNNSERNLIRDYEPAIDAEQKPCLLEKLSNEYEYPTLGKFMYVAVPTAVPKKIANSDYGSELPQQCYIKPSAGAIVPTDIKLTPTTQIVMHIGDLGNFDEVSADATEEEILKSRVMVGAQPNLLISAYDENDVRRGLPGYAESHSISTDDLIWQLFGGKCLYFGGCSNILYSTSDTDGNFIMPSITEPIAIMFGYDVADPENANFDSDSLNKILTTAYSISSPDYINKKAVTPTYSQFNNEMNTPICFFGNYNETTMKADEVIALGYQEALSQIGYTTGIRYEIKRIEIYDRDSDGSISKKHMLVPARDTNDKVLLYDTITEKSYYPFNGTLDVTSGTPTIQDIPAPTIITNTYIKPSEGAIVPTDIKFTSLTNITMHVKGFDNFEAEPDESARAMIGAFPHLSISPFNRNDAEQGFPVIGRPSQEQLDLLGDSSIGLIFGGGGKTIYSPFITNYGGTYATGTPQTLTMDGEHVITFGYDPIDINNINMDNDTDLIKKISIDEQGQMLLQRSYPTGVYNSFNNQMVTPICIFGKYNSPTESMTPDDVIALGYENALSQIGYVTGARYGVKQIDIDVRNADGSMTLKHSLVPARDTNGTICLYDTISHKSYYPFHGTLDII